MKISIPYVTPSWNKVYSSRHWRQNQELVDETKEELYYYLRNKFPKQTKKVDIKIDQFKKKPYDSDNVWAKVIIDALKELGVFKDDTPEYIGWVSTRCQKGKEDRTDIEFIISK